MSLVVEHQAEVRVPIRDESDVPMARKYVRDLGRAAGLTEAGVESLAIALSEIARNVLIHAGAGEVFLRREDVGGRRRIVAVTRDEGPGIVDLERAMQDGYTTGRGLGLGLPSARRLVDEFSILSAPGQGTTVVLAMWILERAAR
jgi:serine/threonine-protein kinase RsbT